MIFKEVYIMSEKILPDNQSPYETSSSGGLIIQVYEAEQAVPISGAHVIVSEEKDGKEHILRTLITDESGRTPIITLLTPQKDLSLSPGNPMPYSRYNIRVDKMGYYTTENIDVPVFSGNVSIQPINLIPLPLDTFSGKKKVFVEREPFSSRGLDTANNNIRR